MTPWHRETAIDGTKNRENDALALRGIRERWGKRNSVQVADFDILISLGSAVYKERTSSFELFPLFRGEYRMCFAQRRETSCLLFRFFFVIARTMRRKKKRHPSIVSPIIARLELIKKIPIDDEIFIPSRNGRSVSGKLKWSWSLAKVNNYGKIKL